MEKTTNHLPSLTLLNKIGYSMGNYSYGIISQVIATYIVFYATSILGISGSIVGTVVSISVLWDAVSDPVMGYISDNSNSKRFGRRHQYILIGIVGMTISNAMLWHIGTGLAMQTKVVLLLILLILTKTFLTIYTTPYTALGAELSRDYYERASIQGIRTMFFLLGIVCATVMGILLFFNPTEKYPIGQNNPVAYTNIGLAASSVALLFGIVCLLTTFKYIKRLPKRQKKPENKNIKTLFSGFLDALKNLQYRYIVLGYLFTNIASAIFSTLGLHVYTYTFSLTNTQTGIVVGAQFLICIISQPLWVIISKRVDKKKTVLLGLMISIVGCIYFGVLVLLKDYLQGEIVFLVILSTISGFGIGGLFAMPLSMVADAIDIEELKTGVRNEGTYYGVLTLSYKISQSVAIFIIGLILDIAKFDASLSVQAESTVIILGMTIVIGSMLGFVGGVISYRRYSIRHEMIEDIQEQIKVKTGKKG